MRDPRLPWGLVALLAVACAALAYWTISLRSQVAALEGQLAEIEDRREAFAQMPDVPQEPAEKKGKGRRRAVPDAPTNPLELRELGLIRGKARAALDRHGRNRSKRKKGTRDTEARLDQVRAYASGFGEKNGLDDQTVEEIATGLEALTLVIHDSKDALIAGDVSARDSRLEIREAKSLTWEYFEELIGEEGTTEIRHDLFGYKGD